MLTTRFGPERAPRRTRLARGLSLLGVAGVFAATLQLTALAPAHARTEAPPMALSDAEFWDFFTTMSEPGGTFLSENFVSNEMGFQEVIPTLQKSLTPGGVYLGVGPEQNLTYIANLKPRMAVIFDIRRQNAMQHLMYKALFELSISREEFIERLFARPMGRLGPTASAAALFDSATVAAPSDSAYRTNRDAIVRTLQERHAFALSPEDVASITNLYKVFYDAGPGINYGYRPGMPVIQSMYPTLGMLQSATNADSVPMAFLASEENYGVVRDLHLRNLIVPVVGDFAGPKAIRAVGEYLWKHDLTVTAFYLSNVEQYLFRQGGAADRFYGNVAALPTDRTSTFIRSVPPSGGAMFGMIPGATPFVRGVGNAVPSSFSITIRDSGGRRIFRTVRDSAGTQVVTLMVDSAGQMVPRRVDSTGAATSRDTSMAFSLRAILAGRDSALRQLQPGRVIAVGGSGYTMRLGGSLLASGIATIRENLDAFFAGKVNTYQDIIAMTKTSGWK